MEIKNLKKAAERILKAIDDKEKIIIYGDSDLDGVTATIILSEAISSFGGKVTAVYFPNREKEGYGLTKTGLKFLKKHSPALLIIVDMGITSHKEIKSANKSGFEVMIVDHHEIIDKLPVAKIIVDPKQKGDKYPFKGLSAGGLVFKLSEVLLGKSMAGPLKKSLLELTALSTIADSMPRESENKIFIEEGLTSLEKTFRPGIRAFFENKEFIKSFEPGQRIYKMISILNVRDVKNRLPASYRLLTCPSLSESQELVEKLLIKNKTRKEEMEKIINEIEKRVALKKEPLIFEGDKKFDAILLSAIASIVSGRYNKPAFLYKKMAKESIGTNRSPRGINTVTLMKKCARFTLTFGGHPQASGFRVKNENLEKFRDCLIKQMR